MAEFWIGCQKQKKCGYQYCYIEGNDIPRVDLYEQGVHHCPECECTLFSLLKPDFPLSLEKCYKRNKGALCERTIESNYQIYFIFINKRKNN